MSTAAVPQSAHSGATGRAQPFYRPELDCLRFFAFFAVFVSHVLPSDPKFYLARHIPLGGLFASLGRAGSFGVDLFFLLSAYLITELLLREKERFGRVHLKSFYVRRILRIWPLYFLAIGVAAILARIDPQQRFPALYISGFLLLMGNWLTSLRGLPGSVVTPLWSVSFEEQFYLLWPAALQKARGARDLLAASGLLLVLAQFGRLLLLKYARHSETAIFTNSIARLDPLAFGIATAVCLRSKTVTLRPFSRLFLAMAGAAAWIAAGHYYGMSRSFLVLGYPAMAIGSWLLFMSVYGAGVAPRWLRYLGKISYGLYVFHMLALYVVERILGNLGQHWSKLALLCAMALAIDVALAAASYRFLEMPFLRAKERFSFIRSRPV